ncbi:MAG: hypothetical protein IPO07_01050 [Haliscomenobacter sp.]|nr:hypothetical protein [Haliscomenobacter sp.]MBK9487517.1 hypothetical protein [Haliscomenobacter sp.]
MLKTLDGHRQQPVISIEFTQDGQRLVSGGDDKRALLWNWAEGKVIVELGTHQTIVRSIATPQMAHTLPPLDRMNDLFQIWDEQKALLSENFRTHRTNESGFYTMTARPLLVAPLEQERQGFDLEWTAL